MAYGVLHNEFNGDIDMPVIDPVSEGTPKYAKISTSASGATAIVAAVTGYKIRVIGAKLMAAGSVNAKWQSAATDLTGLSYLVAGGGEVLPYNPAGWFETVAGEALNLNLSAAVAVGGHITYIETKV